MMVTKEPLWLWSDVPMDSQSVSDVDRSSAGDRQLAYVAGDSLVVVLLLLDEFKHYYAKRCM